MTERAHYVGVAKDQSDSMPDAPLFRQTTLPDGRLLVVRPARAEDVDRMIEFYRSLPLEDRYLRFFTGGLPPRSHFERVVDVASHGGVALVVEVVGDAATQFVGDACYMPQADGDGELAVTIDPAWRGWLGPYLLDGLLDAAAANGVMTLRAEILVRNRPMLALVRARGCVTVGDDDLSKVRVAVGTASRTPSWPPRDARRRILVESSNPRWRSGMTAVAPTVNVMVCAGPPTGYRERCPVLAGRACPLAAEADAIVVARPLDDELGRDLVDAHLRNNADIPLLIEVAAEPSDASVPHGSRALPRRLSDAAAAAAILGAIS